MSEIGAALGRLDVVVGVAERRRPSARPAGAPTVVLPAPIGPTRTTRGAVIGPHRNLSVSR